MIKFKINQQIFKRLNIKTLAKRIATKTPEVFYKKIVTEKNKVIDGIYMI